MRANYAAASNLEKRQSLNAFVVKAEGTFVNELLSSVAPRSVVFDVGCGNGLWMQQVAARTQVVGLDLSSPLLVGARARAARPVVCGDARRLPFSARSADAVLMLWMLYHVSDKRAALAEVARVLRPGGRLIASTNAPSEVGDHADIIRRALSDVLQRPIDQWIAPLDFNADNGEVVLSEQFSTVTTHEWSVEIELQEPSPLVAYLDSVRDPIEAEVGCPLPWTEVLDTAQHLIEDHIASRGSLCFARRGANFLANATS